MFTFLGIVIIIASLVLLAFKQKTNWTSRKAVIGVITGILMIGFTNIFFYADPGTAYAVQYPWGSQKAVFKQGINTKMWGRLIPIQFELPIKYVIPDNEGNLGEQSDYANVDKAKYWAFSDAVKARIATSVVISINTGDETQFLSVADRNKTEKNLIRSRIIPNIDQSIKNTCKLMDAQDYISGKASDFDRYFKDQLENGMYVLEEYIVNEEKEIIGDSTTVRTIPNNDTKQRKYRIKYVSGKPVRVKGNSMNGYGLTVIQAVVTEIDWEPAFDKRLQLQKEEVAQTQLEKQQAERQFYRTQKEIANGEAEKAKERARLEKEQIQKTIAAETESKVATFNLVKEKKQFEVEVFKAKSKKVAADAKYYENVKLVSAGLTPQQKLEGSVRMNRDKWEYISKLNLPTYYLSGGGSQKGETGMLESILSIELLKNPNLNK